MLSAGCAKQGFPPGGPEDKTPPSVERTMPGNGDVRVPARTDVTVFFSEPVKPRGSAEAVFLSPHQGENVRMKWAGARLTLSFRQPLRDSCTYVVTLGTAVQDFRGNRMAESYTFAFSTGGQVDEGRITGRVTAEAGCSGVDVWAYPCSEGHEPDPSILEPDYIVQCAESGAFAFSHLRPARYRLFAVRDRNADRLYQAGDDEIGVPCFDALPDSSGVLDADSCFLMLHREAGAPPSIARVTAPDNRHAVLRFDRMLDPLRLPTGADVTVTGGPGPGDTLAVLGAVLRRDTSRDLVLTTSEQTAEREYTLLVRPEWNADLPDSSGWRGVFRGSPVPDTARPALVSTLPRHRENAFSPFDPLQIEFSEAMDTASVAKGFALTDSAGQSVAGSLRWNSAAEARFVPVRPLLASARYSCRFDGKTIADAAGNAGPDSVLQFRTLNTDTLSEISGTVRESSAGRTGGFRITARPAGKSGTVRADTVPASGPYRLRNMLPGAYLLECFRDTNGDGRYGYGRPFPFQSSEPFIACPDTVALRSRWPNEGNNLVVP
jgi:hypothetical protein